METSVNKKLKAISYLEESDTFPKEEIYFELMRYMVHEEEEGNIVKSSTIAFELVNKKDKNEKLNDSFVRTKVFKLRRALEIFYLSEGKDTEYKIHIPKGKYKIDLQESNGAVINDKDLSTFKKYKGYKLTTVLIIALSVLCLFLFVLLLKDRFGRQAQSSFVSAFIDKDKPLDIFLGDRAFYFEYDTILQRKRMIFDTDVSLPSHRIKLRKIQNMFPERNITPTRGFSHTDTDNMPFVAKLYAEWTINKQASGIYFSSKKKEIKNNSFFMSKTSSGDLNELFAAYFLDSKCIFSSVKPGASSIEAFDLPDSVIKLSSTSKVIEGKKHYFAYCLLKKVSTPTKHEIFFLLPSNDASRRYMTKKIFDQDFKQELIDSFQGKESDNFELLLEITGGNYAHASAHKIIYNSVVL